MRVFGDRAVRVALPAGVDRAAALRALCERPGVEDVAFADDEALLGHPQGRPPDLAGFAWPLGPPSGRAHVLRAVLDGPDRPAGAWAEDFLATPLEVRFLGFQPGFAYLGDLPPALRLPRRASPRPRVPPGALAVGGPYAGVYPRGSPGGWSLVGRADPPPIGLLAPGDTVRWAAVEALGGAPEDPVDPEAPPAGAIRSALALDRVAGVVTVQDAGRRGFAWAGVPPGGALVPEALAAANAAVGNPEGAAALEVLGALAFRTDRPWATDDGARGVGDAALPAAARVRYLAVAGGIAVAPRFGGRGTSWQAGIGRPLRAGDVLAAGASWGVAAVRGVARAPEAVPVLPGPDPFPAEAWERLLAGPWRVAGCDRVGARLAGPPLPSPPRERSAPMVRGAVQVPPDGRPIVLGPDHPTTGGYPVIAVVPSWAWGAVGARAPGDPVSFARA